MSRARITGWLALLAALSGCGVLAGLDGFTDLPATTGTGAATGTGTGGTGGIGGKDGCGTPGSPGNDLGVGKYCTHLGGECQNQPASLCTIDFGVEAAFCTKLCNGDEDCGAGASCIDFMGQTGCVPEVCCAQSQICGSTSSSSGTGGSDGGSCLSCRAAWDAAADTVDKANLCAGEDQAYSALVACACGAGACVSFCEPDGCGDPMGPGSGCQVCVQSDPDSGVGGCATEYNACLP